MCPGGGVDGHDWPSSGTGTELADLLVEAARTALPADGTDHAWRDRDLFGRHLRRDILPDVICRVLVDAPEGARNEALRHVAGTRRLEA